MKQLQRFTLVALTMALMWLAGATSALATALEVGGAAQNKEVSIVASLKSGTSLILSTTDGVFVNTCTASTVEGKTEGTFIGATVSGKVSGLSFSKCTEEKVVVDTMGSLTVENIAGTTNGTVRSIGAKVTVPSSLGALTCVTAASPGTDIGTLTGVKEGSATMDINAVLNCGFFLPSAKWQGTYTVTSPEGLGIITSPASTTLEVGGEGRGDSVSVKASLKAGTSVYLEDTGGFFANTCTGSSVEGKTEGAFTGTAVGGKLSALSFSSCTEEPVVVDEAGSLSVERIGGTTNATVRSIGAKVTSPSPFGSLVCTTKTGEGTDIGTLTGVKEGNATMDIKAVLNCGFFLPSAKWQASYTITSPEGLGVTDIPAPITTALEVGGAAKAESVSVKASLKAGTSVYLEDTGSFFANTCTGSSVEGKTEGSFTGTRVSGKVSAMSFSACTEEPVVVDEAGSLGVERIGGTTNATVRSIGAKVTSPSPFGSLVCTTKTGEGTDIGTLTGVKEGAATMDISAVLNCGFFLPSAKWQGTYSVTTPEGLGVTS